MSFFLIKNTREYKDLYIYRVKEILPFKIFKRNSNKKKCLNHITNIIWKNIHSLYFVLFYTHH